MSKSAIDAEDAVAEFSEIFRHKLSSVLKLKEVIGPMITEKSNGLNDTLSGTERCVDFDTISGENCEIVHSLAKWKRFYLSKNLDILGIGKPREGILVQMNAIRRDETVGPLHSFFVEQFDWEVVIEKSKRKMETLEDVVNRIYGVFKSVEALVFEKYGIPQTLPEKIVFVSSQFLEDEYPSSTPKERELLISRKHKAVFISQIGKVLKSGKIHDFRAPDYDDWELNGDIVFYYEPLDCSLEVSSMGIRVCEDSLVTQMKAAKSQELPFHRLLLDLKLPYTIGGGIGKARTMMYYLKKQHIGEVCASVWTKKTKDECKAAGLVIL